jgi:hypothetical protein
MRGRILHSVASVCGRAGLLSIATFKNLKRTRTPDCTEYPWPANLPMIGYELLKTNCPPADQDSKQTAGADGSALLSAGLKLP